MRSIYLLLVLVFFGCKSNSQESQKDLPAKTVSTTEITWQPDFNAALAEAKQRGELLFVECYLPTCPVCQSMEPFFKTPEVAKKYNSSFINFKLDGGKAELVKQLNDRNIWMPSFPQFLFFDGDGNLVHQSEVSPSIESMVGIADAALDPNKRASSYKKRYENGERNMDLLANYAAFARITRDTTAGIEAASELFKIFPKDQISTELSWKLTKKCVSDVDNGFAQYWFAHKDVAKAFETHEGHPGNEDNILGGIIQNSLYGKRGKDYDIAKLNKIKEYMRQSGAGQYVDAVTWEFETKAQIRENHPEKALAIGNKMINAYHGNGSAYVYIVRVFNDNFPNNNYLADARKWLEEAKPLLNQDNMKAEYFYESARIYQKAGDKVKAKIDAEQAKALAVKTAGTNMAKFDALLSSLN